MLTETSFEMLQVKLNFIKQVFGRAKKICAFQVSSENSPWVGR